MYFLFFKYRAALVYFLWTDANTAVSGNISSYTTRTTIQENPNVQIVAVVQELQWMAK